MRARRRRSSAAVRRRGPARSASRTGVRAVSRRGRRVPAPGSGGAAPAARGTLGARRGAPRTRSSIPRASFWSPRRIRVRAAGAAIPGAPAHATRPPCGITSDASSGPLLDRIDLQVETPAGRVRRLGGRARRGRRHGLRPPPRRGRARASARASRRRAGGPERVRVGARRAAARAAGRPRGLEVLAAAERATALLRPAPSTACCGWRGRSRTSREPRPSRRDI